MSQLPAYASAGFVGGAVAFAHCLGMCGGFALHLAGGESRAGVLARQLLWHAGKASTYVFLGALAGFAGGLVGAAPRLGWLQDALAYVAGGIMVLMGLKLAGLLPGRRSASAGDGLLAGLFERFFGRPTPSAAFVLGLATGFLPCPVVLGMLAVALQSKSVPLGMVVMASMGLGTVWSLLLLGATGHAIHVRLRRWGSVFAAAVLVLLGTVTILRGTDVMHRLMGHGGHAGHQAAPAAEPAGGAVHDHHMP